MQTFWFCKLIENRFKKPYGPFGRKPARASASIQVIGVPAKHFGLVKYQEKTSKRPYKPFESKPARVLAFIGVSVSYCIGRRCPQGSGIKQYRNSVERDKLSNTDTLAGIAMPARALASNNINTPLNAKALVGLDPKGAQGLLEACFVILFTNPKLTNLPSFLERCPHMH